MKKGLIGLLGLISVSIITLASCGGANNTGANPMGTGSWGANEVSKNIEAQKEDNVPAEEVIPVNYVIAGEKAFDKNDIVSQEYAKYGLIAVRNDYGYVGFYSLNHNNWLLEKQYLEKVLNFDVVPDANVGYFLRIIYDDILYVYDSLGNKVLESTKDNDCNYRDSICTISSSYINKKVYLTVTDEENITTYYEYSSAGNISKISSLPQAQAVVDNNEASPFAKNSKYIDLNKVDLKEYGLDGYYLSNKDELVTVFDKATNTPKSTFTVPNGSTMVLVGNKLIYQNSYTVSEDEKNYSYYDGRNKYIVETYTVDLLNGEKKAINVAYKIENVFGPYMDKDGAYSYSLIGKRSFENNVLKSNEMVIIDSTGTIVSNLNGYEANDFVKIGTSYYNTVTKVLYDSTLKEIAYLEAINPEMMEKYNCFVGTVKNKYGIVNSNGNVAIPFDYTELYTDFIESGYVFGVKNEALYRVNVQTGNEELLGTIYKKYNNYIYIIDNSSNSFNIVFVKNNIEDNISADKYDTLGSLDSKLFDSNVIKFTTTVEDYYGQGEDYIEENFINVSKNVVPNKATYITQGTEITSNAKLGEKRTDEVETITTGVNKMYITSANGNYFKFVPTEDGYYNLPRKYKNYTVNLNAFLYTAPDPEILNSEPTYQALTVNQEIYGNIVRLEKGKTYYFLVSTNYTSHGTIYLDLEMEKGEHSQYPIFHKLTDTQTFDYFETGTYIELIVKGGGYYKLNNPSAMSYALLNNNSQYIPTGYKQGNSLNQIIKNNNTYFQLNEFSTYLIYVSSYNTMDSFRFGISYATDETLNPLGSSVINPVVLNIGDNNVSYTKVDYYKYHATQDCDIRLSSTNSSILGNYGYARIYEGEYNPTLDNYDYNNDKYNYIRVDNGGIFEAKKDTDYYIRVVNGNSSNSATKYVLNVEELTETYSADSFEATVSGTNTYYFNPETSGLRSVTSDVDKGDKLIGYDIYNRVIFEEIAETSGTLSYTHYFANTAFYKVTRITKNSKTLEINSATSANNQYLIESALNTVQFTSIYSNTTMYFTPKADGTYSFAMSGGGNLYSLTIQDEKNNDVEVYSKTDSITYYVAKLEDGIKYKIIAQSSSTGVKNMMVAYEYGQSWFAPITLNPLQVVDATEFLKKTGADEAYLYAQITFPEAQRFEFTGFDCYSTTMQKNPSSYIGNYVSVNTSYTYYLRATINKNNSIVSSELYDTVTEGYSIYNPIKFTEGPLEGTVTAATTRYYLFENNNPTAKFIEFNAETSTNINDIAVYDENYKICNISNDGITLVEAGAKAIVELTIGASGDYSLDLDIVDYADYQLNNFNLVLDTENPSKIVEFVPTEITYVKITASSVTIVTTEPNTDAVILKIKDKNGNSLVTAASENGVAEVSYKFNELYKYTIEFEGTGTFLVEYGYNPLEITDNDFIIDEEVNTYTSTNKDSDTTGSMTIKVDCNLYLSFDVLLSAGNYDKVVIERTRNTTTTTLKTYNGDSYTSEDVVNKFSSSDLQKGDVITIKYVRSSYSENNKNIAVISNINYSLLALV